MFNNLFIVTTQQMGKFSDTVRDEFGQSIVSDVFEPLLQDISGLQQMRELFQIRAAVIDQLTEELQSIGSMGHE
jgi:protoporphyrinogen oxidase